MKARIDGYIEFSWVRPVMAAAAMALSMRLAFACLLGQEGTGFVDSGDRGID